MMTQDHANSVSKWPANNQKKQGCGIYYNNAGLDKLESSVEKGETIRLASIFGGTSTD